MTLCLLAGTSAFAQDSAKAPRTKERPTAEQMAQRKTDRMVEKLNLSEDAVEAALRTQPAGGKGDAGAGTSGCAPPARPRPRRCKGILTPEQFEQWKQMQGPRHGMNRGPRMKARPAAMKAAMREGRKCAPCKEGRKCDKPASRERSRK